MSTPISFTTPLREFKGHEGWTRAVAILPDKGWMVTGSNDKTLRLWDLKTGVVLKKMEGHRKEVGALAVSRDGQLIASGDVGGEVIVWHGETGESLTQPFKAHFSHILSLDFSSDGTVLATGSWDKTTELWNTKTWQPQGGPIQCGSEVRCIRYSPSGTLLAIATVFNIQIYNPGTRECVTSFKGHTKHNWSLAWTPDGTRLLTGGDDRDPTLTGGNKDDPTIRVWDTTTWQQVGNPWTGHTSYIQAIAVNPTGTFVASASFDNHVRLWQFSNRRTIATFKHSSWTQCVTFSVDGKHILSGGKDKMISEWAPQDFHPKACLHP
jgi:WD40 repeat protein